MSRSSWAIILLSIAPLKFLLKRKSFKFYLFHVDRILISALLTDLCNCGFRDLGMTTYLMVIFVRKFKLFSEQKV